MTSIPVGACSLDDAALAARAERWRTAIGPAVIDRRPAPAGMVTRVRRTADVEAELRELVRLEAECCPHLDFRIGEEADDLLLEVSFRG